MPEIAHTFRRVERSNERANASLQSLDQHRRHDTSLTEARDKRHRFPVPHRYIPDQALSARVPTVETYHVGSDCSFVDKYKAGGVKQTLLADPASARPSHVGSLALCCPQTFF